MKTFISETNDYVRFISIFLGFISFVLVAFILYSLKEILVPVTVAIFLTLLFSPVVEFLYKYKIPKWGSIIFILLFISGLYYLILLLLLPEIYIFPVKIAGYVDNAIPVIRKMLQSFNLTLNDIADKFNFDLTRLRREDALVERIVITTLTGFSIPSLLGDLFLTLLFWVFMISGKKKFELRLQNAFTENKQGVLNTVKIIDGQLQYFMLVETVIGLISGAIISSLLYLFGIEFAFIFGFLAFILNFIPKIGLIIATVVPVLFTFIIYGFATVHIILAVLLFIPVIIIARYIEPHFLGKYINLSPVFVLFSLIFWGWIWGIAGLYLALPIAAVIRILFSNIESLRPLVIILGSRTNLTKDILLSDNGIQKYTE